MNFERTTIPRAAVRGLFARQDRNLALAAAVACTAVVAVGWLSDARVLIYGVMTTVFVIALLPFIALVAGILISAFPPLSWFAAYYRWLERQRHPYVLGGALGTLGGCLAAGSPIEPRPPAAGRHVKVATVAAHVSFLLVFERLLRWRWLALMQVVE